MKPSTQNGAKITKLPAQKHGFGDPALPVLIAAYYDSNIRARARGGDKSRAKHVLLSEEVSFFCLAQVSLLEGDKRRSAHAS